MEHGIILHPGIIEDVSNEKILVRIMSQSACSSCHARGACSVAEVEEKIIEIGKFSPGNWKNGQSVVIKMEQSLGLKAVALGYLVPLMVLIGSVILFLSLLKNEGWAALLSILMLAPYYLVLYLFRGRLKKKFSFSIAAVEQDGKNYVNQVDNRRQDW